MPVERQPSGWYQTDKGRIEPLLDDIYNQTGTIARLRDLMRRVADLERRGS
jgi:hypothetical protein